MTEKEPSAERGDTEGARRGGIQETGGAEKEKELSTTPVLDGAPEQVREFFAAMTTMGPRPHPLFEKLTPEHITKLIDALGKNDERDWDRTAADRRYHFAYFVGSFLMLFAVMVFLLLPHYISGLRKQFDRRQSQPMSPIRLNKCRQCG